MAPPMAAPRRLLPRQPLTPVRRPASNGALQGFCDVPGLVFPREPLTDSRLTAPADGGVVMDIT
jgi:hypothetical protein